MPSTTIPTSLLELLRNRWQPTQAGYSFFDTAWHCEYMGDADRQRHPSWYVYAKDNDGRDSMQMLHSRN